ncbi:MAG: GIY-YIG nuclease family protein [Candidatus Kerfeldbacteria bacterium]|nr:GIY-YIG nuclease family protein [Candidatus Kerfeldbacteria bacterium]
MYYVYIIQSQKDHSFYKGFSSDLKKQLAKHNSKGQKYSSAKVPFRLVWYCAFLEKKDALAFEKYLKSGSGFAFAKKRLIPVSKTSAR